MLQGEVLILELGAVDGLSTSSVVVGEVASLAHEVWNDTVECGSLVAKTFFSGAQGTEVLGRLWNDIGTELEEKRINSVINQFKFLRLIIFYFELK